MRNEYLHLSTRVFLKVGIPLLVLITLGLLLVNPSVIRADEGDFIEKEHSNYLDGVCSLTVAPDGNNVYAVGKKDNTVVVFGRNATTGELAYYARKVDGLDGVDGLASPKSVAVSPDNDHVYVAGWSDDAVAVFSREPSYGLLTYVERVKDGEGPVDGLNGVVSVTVSPDGNHIYTASEYDNAVAVFSRNSSTGALTYVEMQKDGVGGVDGLASSYSVIVSPDNNHVYVAGYGDDAVTVFSRNSSTGALTFIEVHKDDGNSGTIDGLEDPWSVAISPDGMNVYAGTYTDNAVVVFSRNSSTGALTYVETHTDGAGGVDGLNATYSVAVSPDGHYVFSAAYNDSAVAVFSRNPSTGALTFIEAHKDHQYGGSIDGLKGTYAVAVSPDSKHFYAAAYNDDGLVAFESYDPPTAPGAPTSVSATGGNAQATVSWTAPASDGGASITQYTVTSSPGNLTATTAGTSADVTGLTNGTSYTFTVTATNSVGTGSASTASSAITPVGVPGAPTGVSATGGNTKADVSWTGPASNGGAAITQYTVTSSPGNLTAQTSGTSATVTGLTNGTSYTFTVTATNSIGTGSASGASSAVVPATVPGTPTSVSATGGNAEADVSWTAPASNGGAAITQYTVTSSPGSISGTASGTSLTLKGLTNGTAYTFTVTATNSAGTGSASTASDSIYVPPQVVFNIPDSSATLGSGSNAVLAGAVSGGFGSFTAQVDWGDSTSQAATVTGNSVVGGNHTYDSTGSYTATITVTDSAGQQASDSIVFNVTVANATVTIPSVGTTGMAAIAFSIIAMSAWAIYRRTRITN